MSEVTPHKGKTKLAGIRKKR